MLKLILCGLLVAVSVSGEHDCTDITCDERFIQFNHDHNCVPVKEEGECCPSSFNCPTAETHSPSQCHVKGHSYDIGTDLTDEQFDDKCVARCSCVADSEDSAKAHLQCVHIECPSDLGVPPPEGCTWTYSHTQCCHTGTNCNVTDETTFTCHHGDHTHKIGEKFYPDNEPCYQCICMEGYDGTVKEPWCKRINCGMEDHSHHDGCAPIFATGRCCPIGWHCPKESESMMVSSVSPAPAGSPKCRLGTHQMDIEDRVMFEESCVKCKCTMPPYLSCEKVACEHHA